MSFKEASLILQCPKCTVINYLDPFTFWNFKGKIKCAGCDAIWAYELVAGARQGPPQEAKAPHDKESLQRQISATDREIDRLVYELYGLTEEEIKIVERT